MSKITYTNETTGSHHGQLDCEAAIFVNGEIVGFVEYVLYKKQLSSSMSLFIKKDVFPSYSLLNVSNIPWITFLYKDFTRVGATCFGYPGQNPLPS